jgi:hypothetical protein
MIVALSDLMNAVEQDRFSAELNLAAGTKAFRRGLRNHPLFRELVELAENAQARSAIAERIAALSRVEIDARYENRLDAALSAYLTVLADTGEPDVIAQAASAAAVAPNCWWTVEIARDLLMRAVATGHAQVSPVQPLDASVLASAWRETVAKRFQEWFDERKVDSPVETWAWLLDVLDSAQVTGQQGSSLAAPLQGNRTVVPLSLGRRSKNRRRSVRRGISLRHGPRTALYRT